MKNVANLLINELIDHSTAPPNKPGIWIFLCFENDNIAEEIEVFMNKDTLWVACPHLGSMPLDDYHNGLTYPKWFFKPNIAYRMR